MTTPNWMDKWKRSPRQDRRVVIDGKFVEQGPVHQPESLKTEESNGQENSTGTNVAVDGPSQPNNENSEFSGSSGGGDRLGETGTVEPASNALISSTEVTESEKLQAQLEPIDAIAEHVKGSQTIAEIAKILFPPAIPHEALQFIEHAQKAAESVTGTVEPLTVLPAVSENAVSADVLDGQAGRIETAIDEQGHQETLEPIAPATLQNSGEELLSTEVTLADVDKAIASIPAPQTYEDYGKTYTIHPGGSVTENKPEAKDATAPKHD